MAMKLVAAEGGHRCQGCTVNETALYKLTTDEDMDLAWLCEYHAQALADVEMPPQPKWRLVKGNSCGMYQIVDDKGHEHGFRGKYWFSKPVAERVLGLIVMMEGES